MFIYLQDKLIQLILMEYRTVVAMEVISHCTSQDLQETNPSLA